VYDLRRERIREIVGRGRKGVLRSVELDGRRIDCDLLVMSGGRQPAYSLLAQAGARVEYVPESGAFLPTEIAKGSPRRYPPPRTTERPARGSASSVSAKT
jgi:NADPH-dependent 2,4-dienoyl-CoA reductase/sulfur reductase-like enzyme